MPDDLDLLELAPVPPGASAAAARRRTRRRVSGALAGAALCAGVAIAAVASRDTNRTDIDDAPAPVLPPPARIAPDAPAPHPGEGGAIPHPGPVVEGFALGAGGGAGPFPFGAPRAAVVAVAASQIGAPVQELPPTAVPACVGDDRVPAAWTSFTATVWGDLTLSFAGPTADDQRLVAWTVVARPGAERRFRLAGGPALDDPLSTWGRAFGARLEVGRLAGDGGQVDATVHLPEGDVTIVGYTRDSGRAVIAHGGAACRRPG